MVGEEILLEIDSTLNQLIYNAEAMQNVEIQDLSDVEIASFQKTQESLIHHFLHMDQLLDAKRKNLKILNKKSSQYKIQEKIQKFKQLESGYFQVLLQQEKKMPLLSKRRSKRTLAYEPISDFLTKSV